MRRSSNQWVLGANTNKAAGIWFFIAFILEMCSVDHTSLVDSKMTRQRCFLNVGSVCSKAFRADACESCTHPPAANAVPETIFRSARDGYILVTFLPLLLFACFPFLKLNPTSQTWTIHRSPAVIGRVLTLTTDSNLKYQHRCQATGHILQHNKHNTTTRGRSNRILFIPPVSTLFPLTITMELKRVSRSIISHLNSPFPPPIHRFNMESLS